MGLNIHYSSMVDLCFTQAIELAEQGKPHEAIKLFGNTSTTGPSKCVELNGIEGVPADKLENLRASGGLKLLTSALSRTTYTATTSDFEALVPLLEQLTNIIGASSKFNEYIEHYRILCEYNTDKHNDTLLDGAVTLVNGAECDALNGKPTTSNNNAYKQLLANVKQEVRSRVYTRTLDTEKDKCHAEAQQLRDSPPATADNKAIVATLQFQAKVQSP